MFIVGVGISDQGWILVDLPAVNRSHQLVTCCLDGGAESRHHLRPLNFGRRNILEQYGVDGAGFYADE